MKIPVLCQWFFLCWIYDLIFIFISATLVDRDNLYPPDFFLTQKILIMNDEWQPWSNISIFCKPINKEFHIRAIFATLFGQYVNSVVMFTFSTNLVQKIISARLRSNLVLRLIQIYGIRFSCSLFYVRVEIMFLGKFGPKKQNWLFQLKFITYTNLNVLSHCIFFLF